MRGRPAAARRRCARRGCGPVDVGCSVPARAPVRRPGRLPAGLDAVTTMTGPAGTFRPCSGCRAPVVAPFPADWSLDLIKVGPPKGPVDCYLTPHRPGCDVTVTPDGM